VTLVGVRAVFFDVGGTLIHPSPSVGAIYAAVGKRHGFHSSAEALERAFHAAWKIEKSSQAISGLTMSQIDWWRNLVYRTLDLAGLGGPDSQRRAYFDELYDAFARPDAWRVYPDVVESLRSARIRGFHVGAISNWDRRLRPLLDALGVGGLLDSMTISWEVGAEKPAREIFRAALVAADVQPQHALHVGDSYEEDVLGAVAVGMRAALLDRGGKTGAKCSAVRDLREILRSDAVKT
jgi:putative hydrolase of the HAD superfamily